MAAVNLSRNTKVYFTSNVNAVTGVINTAGFTAANLIELQVLDGYSFTQTTNQETIQLDEAGIAPNRGQRSFNTELAPVDWSFSTYIRPFVASGAVTASEKHLWNAIAGDNNFGFIGGIVAPRVTLTGVTRATTATALCTAAGTFATAYPVGSTVNVFGSTTPGFTGQFTVLSSSTSNFTFINPNLTTTSPLSAAGTSMAMGGQWAEGNTTSSFLGFGNSNKHQLVKFGLIFKVDSAFYYVDNCAVDQAVIDFGIDAISMLAWTGKGTAIRNITTPDASFSSATPAVTSAHFITNKLSTVTLNSNINGNGTGGSTAYTVPITGGSITIANNLTYLTPSILGVVNNPIGYFTGARSITGTLNAYLRTGAGSTSALLNDLLASSATSPDTKYNMTVNIGGGSNAVKVELSMPATMLKIPTVNLESVVSTTIEFTAQSYTLAGITDSATDYDIEATNELTVRYYAV